jgi:hypothetical protein
VTDKQGTGSNVSIKYDGGYGAPWLTLYGTPEEIREQIIVTFGYDRASVAEATVAELIVDATRQANGLWNSTTQLGAVPIPEPVIAAPEPKKAPAKRQTAAAKAKAEAATKGKAAAFAEETPAGDSDAPATATPPPADEPPFEPNVDTLIRQIEATTTMQEFAAVWKANQARFTEPDIKAAAAAAQARIKAAA